jgi:hypothetical protein
MFRFCFYDVQTLLIATLIQISAPVWKFLPYIFHFKYMHRSYIHKQRLASLSSTNINRNSDPKKSDKRIQQRYQ